MTETIVEQLARRLSSLPDDALDEAVHTMFARQASSVNNEGVRGQLAALLDYYGLDETAALVEEVLAEQHPVVAPAPRL